MGGAVITLDDWAKVISRQAFAWKRRRKLERKRNPELKFNALYDLLKHPEKYRNATFRIKMPAD